MVRAMSTDLRWRIIWQRKILGYSVADVSTSLNISRRTILHPYEEFLLINTVLSDPALHLDELQREIESHSGRAVDVSTVLRTLRRFGFSRQKLQQVALQRSEVERLEYMASIQLFDPRMLIFLDETGSDKRNALRKFGYGLRGQTPRNVQMLVRGQRVNAIAFMNFEGLLDVHVTERSTNEELFEEFLLRCLMPSLNPFNGFNHRSVVVMDNLSVHKTQDICDMIRQTGALIRFLPVYSPDLNPIEEMFSKVKHYLQLNQAAVISTSQPRLLVLEAFNQVTASDCVGYIRHSGYNI